MEDPEGLLCPVRTTTDTEVAAAILPCILSVLSGSVDQQQCEELRDTLGTRGHYLGSSSYVQQAL